MGTRMRSRGFRYYTAVLLATVSLPLPAFSQVDEGDREAGDIDFKTRLSARY
nr:hypothetical protein [Rhizobium sp. ACO-34A]